MKKGLIVLVVMVLLLMIATSALAQEGTVNVGIGIESNNANVGITSGDNSTYGINSGANSRFFINGRDLDQMFNSTSAMGSSSPQFAPPPQGSFTQQDISLPMPPPPAPVQTVAAPAPAANYDGDIQALYDLSGQANQEREVLADALVQAINIIENLEADVGNLYASTSSNLVIDPEAPATDPDETLTLDAMVTMQSDEIAFLKTRLLINELLTIILLIGTIIIALRMRKAKMDTGYESDKRSHHIA